MKKALKRLIEENFDAAIIDGVLTVRNIRNGVNEQIFIGRDGSLATDLIKVSNGDELGCRNYSDLEEYIATA